MANHWQEAQEEQRAKHGSNIVVASNGKAVLVGNSAIGWRIVTPERILQARTAQGVEMVLEEENLPPLGWN